jgi:hypothetical protein
MDFEDCSDGDFWLGLPSSCCLPLVEVGEIVMRREFSPAVRHAAFVTG